MNVKTDQYMSEPTLIQKISAKYGVNLARRILYKIMYCMIGVGFILLSFCKQE
jgi:hypothetical protein